jgi:hypothetical protein
VIGSQAILGQSPEPPPELCISAGADVCPTNRPERADLIDGCIGEGSPFHATFGCHAQGVDATTAVLPRGWQDRLVRVSHANTRGATGLGVEVHDLVASKTVARREKDVVFPRAAARHRPVDRATLLARVAATGPDPQVRALVVGRIDAAFASPAP